MSPERVDRRKAGRNEGMEKRIKSVAGVVTVRKLDKRGGSKLFKPIK